MKKIFLMTAVLALVGVTSQASELDSAPANTPKGLIVRTDSQGNRVVFKADSMSAISSDNSAASAIAAYAKTENQITVVTENELDRSSSQPSWYWNGYGCGFYCGIGYGYGYGYGYGNGYGFGNGFYNYGFYNYGYGYYYGGYNYGFWW